MRRFVNHLAMIVIHRLRLWSIRFNTIGHLANSPTTIDVKIRLIKKNDKQSSSLPISHVIKDWMKMKKKVNWSIFFFQVKCYGNFFIIFFLSWTIVIENDFFLYKCVRVCCPYYHIVLSLFSFFSIETDFHLHHNSIHYHSKKNVIIKNSILLITFPSHLFIHTINQSFDRSIDPFIHPSYASVFSIINCQLYILILVCVFDYYNTIKTIWSFQNFG